MSLVHKSLTPTRPQHQHHHQPFSYNSTQDWISAYSTPVTPTQLDYHSHSNYVQPSSEDQHSLFDYSTSHNFNNLRIQVQTPFGSSQDPELMPSDHSVAPSSWNFTNGQLTPTSARAHYRESSLSSLGSAGPASPYNISTSHPQVLLPSESGAETYYDGLPAENSHFHTFSKPLTPSQTPSQDSFMVPSYHNYNIHHYHADPHLAAIMAMQKQQSAGDDESIPAPEYNHSGRLSVASTHESPATPPLGEDYEDRKPDFRLASSIPKLDRTMSDAYNDELYSPSFTFTSAPSTKSTESTSFPRPQSDIFSQRLQAANSQHLSASSQIPLGDQTRDSAIHFRAGSPLAPPPNSFTSQSNRLNSAQRMREQQKAENDVRVLQQQIQRSSPQESAPKTISPKDAMLDYHETDEDSAMPLFPPQKNKYQGRTTVLHEPTQSDMDDTASQQSFGSMATSRRESSSTYSTSSHGTLQQGSGFTFAPPSVPGRLHIPQQYLLVPQQRRQPSNTSSVTDRNPEFPSTLTSMESSGSDYMPESVDLEKPAGSSADGGTYTCTYHGCTLRFETPAKLQKHKREGHRQSAPLIGGTTASRSGSSDGGSGMTSAALMRNSQAGPHKCERINPSTGKPCNTIFSRPYDLTRHEDTIHNARKQKVRCHLCTEEKTFSRNDALTRHMRVVHPEVDFPGKSRRRGHD